MRAINCNGGGTLYGNLTSWSVYKLEGVDLTEIQMVGFGENLNIPPDKISAFRRKMRAPLNWIFWTCLENRKQRMTNYALLKIMTKGGCVSITDFVPRKQKLAYDKLHEFRELLKHLPVPAPLRPFSPRAWENCQQFAYHFQSEYFRGEIEHPAFHNPKSGFLG